MAEQFTEWGLNQGLEVGAVVEVVRARSEWVRRRELLSM